MKRFIILLGLALICAVSCNKADDNYLIFSGGEMGTVDNGVFISDGGVKMNIISAPENADITTKRRVMLFFTLKTDAQQLTSYDIDVSEIIDPLILDPAVSEKAENTPEGDAMSALYSWFGGDYLNIIAGYYVDSEKETPQEFSAYYTAKENLTVVAVRRDGKGEGYFCDNPKELTSYLCIPMRNIWYAFHSDENRYMPVNLNWCWYASTEDGTILNNTIAYNISGTYYPDND